MLWLALHLPMLALEALPPTSDAGPRAVSSGGRRGCLQVVDDAAASVGIRSGMGVSEALALCCDLQVLARQPRVEAAAREAVLLWAGQFTSQCTALSDDCLLLEIGASLTLFGGLSAVLRQVTTGLATLGHRVHLAAAPTPDAAALLARHRPGSQVLKLADLPKVLAPLPLECLDIEVRVSERLLGFGLRTIGECRRLPPPALGRRAGPQFLAHLGRLFGSLSRPLAMFVPPEQFNREVALEAPVTDSAGLRPPLRRLLLELQGFLRMRQAGIQVARLDLLSGEDCHPLWLRLAGASREASRLENLFDEHLQRWALPAPVKALRLVGEVLIDDAGPVRDLFDAVVGEPQAQLLDRLRARLGDDAVHGITATADHRPGLDWAYCVPGEEFAGTITALRPAWLLREPQRLRAVAGQPSLDGRLTLLGGPERIEGGWWDGSDVARDYYIASQRSGRRLWIYRERRARGGWYLHGLFA